MPWLLKSLRHTKNSSRLIPVCRTQWSQPFFCHRKLCDISAQDIWAPIGWYYGLNLVRDFGQKGPRDLGQKSPRDTGQRSERCWSIINLTSISRTFDQYLSDLLNWPISLGPWPTSLGLKKVREIRFNRSNVYSFHITALTFVIKLIHRLSNIHYVKSQFYNQWCWRFTQQLYGW